MKMLKLKSSILAGACALLTLIPNFSFVKSGSLKEISKPYLGVYECISARLGEEELLADFSYIQLELKKDGGFILYYGDKAGKKERVQGSYIYDDEKQTLTLQFMDGKCFQRAFPLKKGRLTVSLPIGKRQLCLIFEQK